MLELMFILGGSVIAMIAGFLFKLGRGRGERKRLRERELIFDRMRNAKRNAASAGNDAANVLRKAGAFRQ